MDSLTIKILQKKIPTSATIIPKELRQKYQPQGFTNNTSQIKVLFVTGEPRKYSLTYDLIYTAMKFFEQNHCAVALRDLYNIGFDPVLRAEEFYYVKDGLGHRPHYLAQEQAMIKQADILIFAYPNWHDAPVAIVKGYIEKVFAKNFAYKDTDKGPVGLLTGKQLYTIMNCGYLGGGQGYIGDGIGQNDALWDKYMQAFKVFDDDTAHFWGMHNAGRFVNDQNPSNFGPNYAAKLKQIRHVLCEHLQRDLLN